MGGATRERPSGPADLRLATHCARNPLSRSTIPGNTSTNCSTSAGCDDQPTDTRSECSASTPIAASTGDGSRVSDEHDEPECTATPCWSSASRIGSASTPPTPTHKRLGSDPSPYRSTPSTTDVTTAARSINCRCASVSATTSVPAHAAPNPTHAGT